MPEPENVSLRIIDANLNRAREALRVVEDYARLGLDDAALAAEAKRLRHALAASAPASVASALPAARDIAGDVGCDISTPEEISRADALAAARASGKRLSEALRVIEEYAKTFDSGFAAAVERIRYEGYELERRLERIVSAKGRFAAVRFYVIVTESLCRDDWFTTAAEAVRGGADCLQLREKNLSDRELLSRAKQLAGLSRDRGVLLFVNDRLDIALLAGADGVHLGQDDFPIAAARRLVPPNFLIGFSTHTVEQVHAAANEVPDYIAVGPIFETPTKARQPLAGPATLAAARRHTSIPLAAIGGIDEQNAERVLEAAPCAICVCRAVIAAADVAGAAARLRQIIDRHREHPRESSLSLPQRPASTPPG